MPQGLVWVDIPVTDLDRAIRFYSAVLGAKVNRQEQPGMVIGLLPTGGEDEIGGCLFRSEKFPPSRTGPLIYLGVPGRLDAAEAAVEPNGGEVLQRTHAIDPYGYRCVVVDSEGNRIALHSM